jgi:hypothetical protein
MRSTEDGAVMFADYNRAFVTRQRQMGDCAMAADGADQLLADLGVTFRALPCYFRIDAPAHAGLCQATGLLVSAQDKLARHLAETRSGAELATMFEVPAGMAAHMNWANLAASGPPMLRADVIPTDSGYYFCELNHFCGVGAGEGYHSALAFAELLGRPAAGVSPFRHLAHLYLAECQRLGLTRMVILDTARHRTQGFGEQLMVQRYMRLVAPGIETYYHDEHTYPAEWLAPAEAKRTLVHRIITYDDTPDNGAFLAALRDGGATVSCMFESELKMHRKWFSLLCDPDYQHLLDDQELATVKRYIPHTFDVHPANLDAVLAGKDGLVFKRSYTYGGKGVLIGDEHAPDELRSLLTDGPSAWVAQHRVYSSDLYLPTADRGLAPHSFALGIFMFGNNTSGLLVRAAADSSVVNVSQGGGVSWAFTG